jgi:transaldolase
MKLFLNSCNVEEVKEIAKWGILDGITMNPTMVAAINKDFIKNIQEICHSVDDVPVFAQVVSSRAEDIVKEGKALASLDEKIVVKVHTNIEGIQGMKALKAEGVKVCATAVHSVIESIAVERVGVDHVAVFIGLLGEVDEHSTSDLIASIRAIYDHSGSSTKIMAAVRSLNQLVLAAKAGADEMTVSYKIWSLFFDQAHTENRWNSFIADWTKAYGERNWISGY